jgi:chaperonin GroES
MAKIKPLGKRVLIKRSTAKTTKGGIILPDTAQEKPKEGEVVAVGPGEIDEEGRSHALSLKVGDKILFTAYAGTEVKDQASGEDYLIMSEDEILGVICCDSCH